jgi:hypothetical protein
LFALVSVAVPAAVPSPAVSDVDAVILTPAASLILFVFAVSVICGAVKLLPAFRLTPVCPVMLIESATLYAFASVTFPPVEFSTRLFVVTLASPASVILLAAFTVTVLAGPLLAVTAAPIVTPALFDVKVTLPVDAVMAAPVEIVPPAVIVTPLPPTAPRLLMPPVAPLAVSAVVPVLAMLPAAVTVIIPAPAPLDVNDVAPLPVYVAPIVTAPVLLTLVIPTV